MSRTINRPVPSGRVSRQEALGFGLVLSAFSVVLLGLATNWLAAGLLAFTIFFYAVIYTMWLKRSTPQNIVIGGAAGAFPPMIGWAAVTGTISLEACILFLIIFTVFDLLLSKIAFNRAGSSEVELEVETKQLKYQGNPDTFILMLILLGGLLTIVPEFIYLRDQFGTRMNTIFKFYYQVWILWSLAGSYAVAELFKKSKKRINVVFGTLIAFVGILSLAFSLQQKTSALPAQFGTNALDYLILSIPILFLVWLLQSLIKKSYAPALAVLAMCGIAAGLVYPSVELLNKTEAFMPQDGYSLDGKQDFYLYSGDEMIAAEWLSKADLGVMAEAVADTGGSYTTYNLISTFSGMPTVLGWIGHEAQWRGSYEEIGSRQADLRELYSTSSWERTKAVIDLYNIRYIVVGTLERQTYSADDVKFDDNLVKAFETNSLVIYEVVEP